MSNPEEQPTNKHNCSKKQAEALKSQIVYWKQQLGDVPAVLELPSDHPRLAGKTFRAKTQSLVLPNSLADSLKALGDQEEVTLFMVLLATFQVLLHRYTGQDDIVIGSSIGGHSRVETEGLVRNFVNTLVLRIDCSGNPSFSELLGRVREVVEGACAHKDLPFDQLVEELRLKSDPGHNSLFQVVFTLRNTPMSAQGLPGPNPGNPVSLLDAHSEAAKIDLKLVMVELAQGLNGSFEYNADLFEEVTITRMLGHFRALLEGVVANPGQPISTLPFLTEAERYQLVIEWNDTKVDFPRDACLHQLFEAQVEQNPDAVAVILDDQQLTYRELNSRANQLAHYLRALGVGPDVMVGICVERSLVMVVGLMGILKAGGAYVPMDPDYPKERLAFMLKDIRVPVLLTQKRLVDRLPTHTARTVCLDTDWKTIALESEENPVSGVTPDHLVYIIYTSGSTGRPKGVMLNHRGRVSNFCDFNRRFSVGVGDRLLAISSLGFDMSAYDVFGTLAAGGTTVVARALTNFGIASWAELMIQHQITVWHSVPQLLEMLVDHIIDRPELCPRSLRLVLLGGDWIPVTLPDRLKDLVEGAQVISLGGATEVSMDSTIYDITTSTSNLKNIPYGAPMANQLAYVLDRHLQPVPIGVPGELHLGGVGVARGYLNRPELTAKKFIPNPFKKESNERIYKTGDLARYRPDGNLELLGRMDFQVKIRGFRVELGEIEAALRQHPAVRESVVLARQGTDREKRLVAYVVQDPDYDGTSEEMQEWQRTQVSQWAMVYDSAYSRSSDQKDPTFNIVSWDSSYTGQPLPAEEMREWVDYTVERILAFKPRRVLEIGCGTGLLLFRIAPECTKYWGTDFSQVALDYVSQHLEQQGLSHVSLFQRLADDFEGIEPCSFDVVILNSIIMDFPTIDYLMQVLKGAVKVLAPGGSIFVGDVRSLSLLEVFQTSVQLHKAPASLTKEQLSQGIQRQMSMEEELVIDPAFFAALPQHIPEIGHVQIHLKRGSYHNELTKFRYDLTLHIGSSGVAPKFSGQCLDWQKEALSLESVRRFLRENEPEQLYVKRVPNARTLADDKMVELLKDADGPKTAGALRETLQKIRLEQPGVDPEALWQLRDEFPYSVDVRYPTTGERDCFDVVLMRQASAKKASRTTLFPFSMEVNPHRPLHSYANNPLEAKATCKLTPELRNYLEERLPGYMVPSAFVLLDAFPLSPNGKVNRRALPEPDTVRPELEEAFMAPRTPVEVVLAGIWAEVLGLEQVGIHDSFFALGGHSLLATQAVSRIRDIFQVEILLSYLFTMNIEELGKQLEESGWAAQVDVTEIACTFIQISELSASEVETMLTQ